MTFLIVMGSVLALLVAGLFLFRAYFMRQVAKIDADLDAIEEEIREFRP